LRNDWRKHKDHFQFPVGMVVKGWEEAVHMPAGVTYIKGEHLFLVEGALAYMALGVFGGGGGARGGEGG